MIKNPEILQEFENSRLSTEFEDLALSEWPIYGSASQGRIGRRKGHPVDHLKTIFYDGDPATAFVTHSHYERNVRLKEFEQADHLGNVRLVFTDMKQYDPNTGTNSLDIVAANNYYPFGMLMPDGCYAAGNYRWGFQGQEKDDEVKGTGNHNSALYWAYDTRLGRRWNMDPKPDVSISNYVCFADNPVLHSDPLGDTIKIHAKEGNNNIYAKFYRGKLLNSDGSEYSGSNEYIRTVHSNLVELKSDDNYVNKVINELEDSKYDHTISSNGYKRAEAEPESRVDGKKGKPQGTTIFYDPNDFRTYSSELDGGPMRIILGHELWHAYDYNEGKHNIKAIDPDGKISIREINAVDFENRIRDAIKIPLRNNHSGFTLPIWDPQKPYEPGLKFFNFNAQSGTGSSNSGNRPNDLCPADNVKARNNPIIIKKP